MKKTNSVTPKVSIIGKEGLYNPNLSEKQQPGFSYNLTSIPSKIIFKQQLDCLKKLCGNTKLFSLSYTPSKEFSISKHATIPTIALFDMFNMKVFTPKNIYKNCDLGQDAIMPNADIFVIDTKKLAGIKKKLKVDSLTFLAHTKTAPCFKVTSKDGNYIVFGVLLRPSFLKYGDYIFSNIKSILGEGATFELLLATSYEYDSGIISSSFEKLCANNGVEYVSTEYADPYTDDSLFGSDDIGNNVVLLTV